MCRVYHIMIIAFSFGWAISLEIQDPSLYGLYLLLLLTLRNPNPASSTTHTTFFHHTQACSYVVAVHFLST
jgi:hypothetical protein